MSMHATRTPRRHAMRMQMQCSCDRAAGSVVARRTTQMRCKRNANANTEEKKKKRRSSRRRRGREMCDLASRVTLRLSATAGRRRRRTTKNTRCRQIQQPKRSAEARRLNHHAQPPRDRRKTKRPPRDALRSARSSACSTRRSGGATRGGGARCGSVQSTVIYCTVLYCTVLYCTVLYCTVLYCTLLYCTVLHCTVLYFTVLYGTVL